MYMKLLLLLGTLIFLGACSGEEWRCVADGKTLYSMSSSGKIGGAGKGCSCQQIRQFEQRTFGSVDEDALRSDFGC